MDLLSRFAEWLDSRGWTQDDPAGDDAANEDRQVRVTISFRGLKVDLVRPRQSGKADEASGWHTQTNGTSAATDHDQANGSRLSHAPEIPAASFWDALDPTEREALRMMASLRTFAAGAKIMEEGDRADHVMVIVGGRVKICVNENGRERVLVERGVGQLVGEAGALKVSVRSATVVALDLIWALVVETRDFAAFLTAHPRVMTIVQSQVDQRRTEGPASYGHDYDMIGGSVGTEHGAAPNQTGPGLAAGHFLRRPRPLDGENCTICLTDVVRFGARTRTDEDRRLIRATLFKATRTALQNIADVQTEDRGDGFLSVVPPSVSTAKVMDQLVGELSVALGLHNRTQRESARFQLRLAVNVGPVVNDAAGVTGEAIILAARLVDAPDFKKAVEGSPAGLGVIASPFVYETVIRHDRDPGYTQVPIEVKESEGNAWMRLYRAGSPYPLILHPAVPRDLPWLRNPDSLPPSNRSSLVRVSLRLASEVAWTAWTSDNQRTGAFSFSARAASGARVAMKYRRSACS